MPRKGVEGLRFERLSDEDIKLIYLSLRPQFQKMFNQIGRGESNGQQKKFSIESNECHGVSVARVYDERRIPNPRRQGTSGNQVGGNGPI